MLQPSIILCSDENKLISYTLLSFIQPVLGEISFINKVFGDGSFFYRILEGMCFFYSVMERTIIFLLPFLSLALSCLLCLARSFPLPLLSQYVSGLDPLAKFSLICSGFLPCSSLSHGFPFLLISSMSSFPSFLSSPSFLAVFFL